MANTKLILDQIRIDGVMQDLLAKSDGENVTVTYNGKKQQLSAALAEVFASVSALPTGEDVDGKISAAIGNLVNGAPETGDTLKELFDLIGTNEDAMGMLNEAIGKKADATALTQAIERIATLEGKYHDHGNKTVLDVITAAKVSAWDAKADKTEATTAKAGLMSAADKARLDGLRGVRCGTEVPADMQDGELFVRVVNVSQ